MIPIISFYFIVNSVANNFLHQSFLKMPPKTLTQGEKKKIKQENKAKANPGKAAAKKEKADAKRTRR
jgi:hypothetical protein